MLCSEGRCFLNCKSAEGNEISNILLKEIFLPIEHGSVELIELFVHSMNTREVVSVISAVKPWDRSKFLTHLCVSFGKYDTEFDLFTSGSIKGAFVRAGSLQSADDICQADVLNILRDYVLTDLSFHLISARQFSRYLTAALDTLEAVLIDGVIGDHTPCLSEVTFKEQATAKVIQVELTHRQQLVNGYLTMQRFINSCPLT